MTDRPYQTTYIGAILAGLLLMAALVVSLAIVGRIDSNSTPLIVTVLGATASTIAALLALLRTDRNVVEAKKTNGEVTEMELRLRSLEDKLQQIRGTPAPEHD